MNLVIAASILSFTGVMLKGLESKYERAIKKVWEIKVNDPHITRNAGNFLLIVKPIIQ